MPCRTDYVKIGKLIGCVKMTRSLRRLSQSRPSKASNSSKDTRERFAKQHSLIHLIPQTGFAQVGYAHWMMLHACFLAHEHSGVPELGMEHALPPAAAPPAFGAPTWPCTLARPECHSDYRICNASTPIACLICVYDSSVEVCEFQRVQRGTGVTHYLTMIG